MVDAEGRAALSPDALQAALSVMDVLPASLQRQVSDVTVSSASLVTLRLRGVTVVWGGQEKPEQKLAVVTALLKTSPKPKVVDVSAPDTPVTR
jgi:cell division protein FtsQ